MNNLRSIGIFLIASTTTLTAISQEDSSSRWDLDRCISHALENNINISQSQLEQKVSALEYTQSKFERLPSVNGSASQSLLNPTTTSFGLNANLNIFNILRNNLLPEEYEQLDLEYCEYFRPGQKELSEWVRSERKRGEHEAWKEKRRRLLEQKKKLLLRSLTE